jgi:transcription initiation factor TFIIB
MREIRRIIEILGIGAPVAEWSAYIYRKALDKGLIKGRSIAGIVAATIYVACKDTGTARSRHDNSRSHRQRRQEKHRLLLQVPAARNEDS